MRRFRAIPPPLRRELEARLAGDLRSARSSIVMIDGPVGSGKSSMLDRIADLTGRTMPTIGPLDASAPLVLAELALAVGAPATASPEVVLERLVGMATEPLVVAIDDLDHGTARLSHLLAAAVRSADHLAVVATVRRARGFAGAARGLVRELDRGVDHERIHLDPLSADDITAWLRAGLDPVAEPTHGAIVWRWSGGLPALVDQIVADAERTRPTAPLQAIDEPDFAPVTGEVVLDRWLALFEPEGLEIIEAVALAGSVRDDERHLIAAACNAPLASVDHVIEAALADGVLADDRGGSGRSVRIGARSLRDGLIRRTPPDRRRRMLDVLVATDPGVERPRQAARLLAHTEHRPLTDDDIATLSAASEEIATVDPDRAAQWAEVVATQAGPETVIGARAVNRSAELRSLAARVHRDLDPPPWQRITDPATRDATAALALYAGLYANDWHAVIDQAEAVAPVVDEDPELWPTTRAAVLSVLTPCGRHQWARELAERWMPTVAPEDRSVLDDFAVVGLQPGSQRRDNLRELQEIVARLPDDTPLAMRVNVVMAEVLALLTTGPMQLLRDRVAELHADPIISTLPMAIDGLLIASSYEAYLAGRWGELEEFRSKMISFPLAIESWDTIEYFVRVRRGEVALDRPNWEPGLGAQSGFTAAATAEAFRRAGRPDLAMTIVEDELDASERTDDLVFAVDIGVQAALDLRDPDRARAVLDRLEPATSDHHLATEMRCVARVERDGALAMRSAEVAGASGYHLSELESLALAAGLGSLDADGCRDARRRIEAVGDPELLRQIDTAMLRRSVRIDLVQDSAEMSPLEQLIVDGVRRGQTNAEIAAELGVSAHVVGNRLRGLFRRHGVANRAELAATFVAGG